MAPWVEALVALLLVVSGVAVLISAVGFLRLEDFFARMHPPAIAYTLGTWTVSLAAVITFSAVGSSLVLHPWLVVILLGITVPVTTVLLARLVLFRRRTSGVPGTPPAFGQRLAAAAAPQSRRSRRPDPARG